MLFLRYNATVTGTVSFTRRIGTAIFPSKRMPLLEELFEPVVLKTTSLDPDTVSAMKNYSPPALSAQVEASLCKEFNRHIVKTNWLNYQDPIMASEQEQAARLLQYTLATMKRVLGKSPSLNPLKDEGESTLNWIKSECEVLEEEIKTGNCKRWSDVGKLAGPKWRSMSKEQQDALTPSIMLVAKNPYMYPSVKKRIIDEIDRIIRKTIK